MIDFSNLKVGMRFRWKFSKHEYILAVVSVYYYVLIDLKHGISWSMHPVDNIADVFDGDPDNFELIEH